MSKGGLNPFAGESSGNNSGRGGGGYRQGEHKDRNAGFNGNMRPDEFQLRMQAAYCHIEGSSPSSLMFLKDTVNLIELERQQESLDRMERRLNEIHVDLDRRESPFRKIRSKLGGFFTRMKKAAKRKQREKDQRATIVSTQRQREGFSEWAMETLEFFRRWLDDSSPTELYLMEQKHIRKNGRLLDDAISITIATKDNLSHQRSIVSGTPGRMQRIAHRFPLINIKRINVRMSRDSLILGGVIVVCIIILLLCAALKHRD